jgi:putative transposase
VFLPNHWHTILLPRYPTTISLTMESIKVSSMRQINKLGGEAVLLWQGRFFDRAVRTVKEYHEKVEYIHLNPVKRGLVNKPEQWKWSSIHDYSGTVGQVKVTGSVLPIDRVLLPADRRARI